MKIQVTQENLNKALGTVARVASSRGSLPVLNNILLKTVGKRLCLAATNLDIAISRFIGAKVVKEGAITVPARLTHDFINSLPPGTVTLALEDNRLRINTEKYDSIINGIAAEDYPVLPTIEAGDEWSIAGRTLKEGLQQVLIAASSDEARPVLTGLYLHTHEGALYAVATDSYRLAEKKLMPVKQNTNLLIPATAAQELFRIIKDEEEEEVSVKHDDQQALFRVGDVELVTRLIDGEYPDYRKLIPKEFSTEATLKRDELINVVKVSSLFARESAGSITLNLSSETNQLNIHSIATQMGENTARADAEVKGDGTVTLNSRYLLDALNVMSGDMVSLGFNSKLAPVVLREPKTKDPLHVIMPLKS